MGKEELQHQLPATVDAQGAAHGHSGANSSCNSCRGWLKWVRLRCVLMLLLGLGVFLSAFFWLPFFRFKGHHDLDLDSRFPGHDIVASFLVEKPVSFLEDYTLQLEDDIFDEISPPNTKVEILSLEALDGSNITKVIFAYNSDVKNARVSTTARSLIRASFVSLVIHQSYLQLTASLFGQPFSFEVLKFIGGITVSPRQSAFLMQKELIKFNFTLNFSIDQIQDNFGELARQLRLGLHLAAYENLYISLTNMKGSTVAPPTTVQSQVLLAVGINPSSSRLKQLTQTITGSSAKNLGLNNTVFGRVKQVRLSSVMQHPPGGDGSPSASPSPSPLSHPYRHNNHHHHHHHHHQEISPATAPSPGPSKSGSISATEAPTHAPVRSHEAKPPACPFGNRKKSPRKGNKHSLITPIQPPYPAPYIAPAPQKRIDTPSPSPHHVPASSPLPHVVFAHVQPPSKSISVAKPPDMMAPVSASSSSCILPFKLRAIATCLLLVLHL